MARPATVAARARMRAARLRRAACPIPALRARFDLVSSDQRVQHFRVRSQFIRDGQRFDRRRGHRWRESVIGYCTMQSRVVRVVSQAVPGSDAGQDGLQFFLGRIGQRFFDLRHPRREQRQSELADEI